MNTGHLVRTWSGDGRRYAEYATRVGKVERFGFMDWGYRVRTWIRMGYNHYDHQWAMLGVLPQTPTYLNLPEYDYEYRGFVTRRGAERHRLKNYIIKR